jgi:hypothetical protein
VFALLNRIAALRIPLTLIYVLGILAILLKVKRSIGQQFCVSQASVVCSHGGLPSSPRMTAIGNPTVLEQPGLKSTEITIHNLRNCDSRTETDYANWLCVGVISMQTASTSKSVYEGEFDDVKTDAGEREVPFDKRGLMKSALIGRWNASQHRQADDLVFSTRNGGILGRRNLLRHIVGLSKAVDFRSFRPMHSSLMLREGARPEVVRDNMGHANIDVTQNVYGKSWWVERVDAVTRAVEAVSAAQNAAREAKPDQHESVRNEWVPLWVPQPGAKIASC